MEKLVSDNGSGPLAPKSMLVSHDINPLGFF